MLTKDLLSPPPSKGSFKGSSKGSSAQSRFLEAAKTCSAKGRSSKGGKSPRTGRFVKRIDYGSLVNNPKAKEVAMDHWNYADWSRDDAIWTRDLCGCRAIMIVSRQGAFLIHLRPQSEADAITALARAKLDYTQHAAALHGAKAVIVSGKLDGQVGLPDLKATIENTIAGWGHQVISDTYDMINTQGDQAHLAGIKGQGSAGVNKEGTGKAAYIEGRRIITIA